MEKNTRPNNLALVFASLELCSTFGHFKSNAAHPEFGKVIIDLDWRLLRFHFFSSSSGAVHVWHQEVH